MSTSTLSQPQRTVLIVDDAAALRGVLIALFEKIGYRVVGEVSDGNSALEAYERLRPDLVCLDFYLPGLNGLEVLKRLRNKDPAARVLMITVNRSAEFKAAARAAGAVGYLCKPFTQAQFEAALAELAARQQRHQADRTAPLNTVVAATNVQQSSKG